MTESPEEAARSAVLRYFQIGDEVVGDPDSPTNGKKLASAALGTALIEMQNELNAARSQKVHTRGRMNILSVRNPVLELRTINLKKTPPEVPTARFDVCYDVGSVRVINAGGVDITPKNLPPRKFAQIGAADYGNGWRVAWKKSIKAFQC